MRKNSKLLVSVVSAGIFLFTASMETDADTQNLLRKATIYTADGAEKLIRSYEYDDNGNKTELHFWAMGADGSGWTHTTYEYDLSGIRTGCSISDDNKKLLGTCMYEYSEDGNIITEYSYDNKGKLIFYTINEYDGQDNLVKQENYWDDGTLASSTEYQIQYDEDGRKEKAARTDKYEREEGQETEESDIVIEYQWDEEGNLLSEQEYQNGELVSYIEYQYE